MTDRLKGCGTALVTPFCDGKVDYEAYGRLVRRQLEAGVDFLVPLATTGETPTLSPDEKTRLLRMTRELAPDTPIVAGVGSNSLDATLENISLLVGFENIRATSLHRPENLAFEGRSIAGIAAARGCLHTLMNAGCDAVVIACNTATAVAAGALRSEYPDFPILGLEPAVGPALRAERGKILLLATPATARHKTYPPRVIVGVERNLASDVERAYGCPSALHALARRTLSAYSGYSAVVTGCSHYAHLAPYMHCRVYDGADGVARRLAAIFSSVRT